MIFIDKEGSLVIKSKEKNVGVERVIEYQNALLHLIKHQNPEFFDAEINQSACELLAELLPSYNQVIKNQIKLHDNID